MNESNTDQLEIKSGEVLIIGGCGCCGSPYFSSVEDILLATAAPEMYALLESYQTYSDPEIFKEDVLQLLTRINQSA